MADEIVIKYVGDLDKLQSELRETEKQQLAIDKQAKKTGTTITNESNKAAAGVQKVNKNVTGLKDSFQTLSQNLPFGGAIQQVTQLSDAMSGLVKGTAGATNGMKVLRAAVISTGVGALVVALIALIGYFKRTDEGATKLEGIMGALGAALDEVTGFIAEMGSIIFNALESVDNFAQALRDLGEFVITNLINRFKSVLVYGEAIGLLFKGEFAAATKKAADGLIQMNTGIENGTDKFNKFADRIAAAAKEAYDFAIAMDRISDAQRDLNVELSANRILVVELIKQSKNHSFTLDERQKKLKEANAIDEEGLRKTLELENEKLELIKRRNQREKDSINQRLNNAIREAKSEEEVIKLKQKSLSINDNLAQEEADQIIKINGLRAESIALQERNNSAIAALQEQAIAEALENEKRKNTQIENIEKQRFLDGEISFEQLVDKQEEILLNSLNEQKNILISFNKDVTEINKAILDAEIKAEKEKNEALLKEKKDELDRERSLEEQANREAIALADRQAAEIFKINQKHEEDKKALRIQGLQTAIDVATNLANAINQINLQEKTSQIEEERSANEKITENKLANLEKRKQDGIISEAQFSAQRDKILKESAKKEAELKRRQFEAQKQASLNQVKIDTAVAIVKTLATYGFTPIAAIAIAGALANAAIQAAVINKQKPPKFKDGVIDLKGKGTGKSDSIPSLLSRGESVMTAEETSEYKPLFTAIRNKKFKEYAYENIARPAIKRELEIRRKKEERAEGFMKLIAENGTDTSHLERLTKSNKKVMIVNTKEIAHEIAGVIKPKTNKGL